MQLVRATPATKRSPGRIGVPARGWRRSSATIAELEKEAAPTAATEVSRRVAELRRRLAEGTEGADDRR